MVSACNVQTNAHNTARSPLRYLWDLGLSSKAGQLLPVFHQHHNVVTPNSLTQDMTVANPVLD